MCTKYAHTFNKKTIYRSVDLMMSFFFWSQPISSLFIIMCDWMMIRWNGKRFVYINKVDAYFVLLTEKWSNFCQLFVTQHLMSNCGILLGQARRACVRNKRVIFDLSSNYGRFETCDRQRFDIICLSVACTVHLAKLRAESNNSFA